MKNALLPAPSQAAPAAKARAIPPTLLLMKGQSVRTISFADEAARAGWLAAWGDEFDSCEAL